jgi:hypothetical protein
MHSEYLGQLEAMLDSAIKRNVDQERINAALLKMINRIAEKLEVSITDLEDGLLTPGNN